MVHSKKKVLKIKGRKHHNDLLTYYIHKYEGLQKNLEQLISNITKLATHYKNMSKISLFSAFMYDAK